MPLPVSFAPGATVLVPISGEPGCEKKRAMYLGYSGQYLKVSDSFSLHAYRQYAPADVELAEPLSKRNGFSLEEDLNPLMYGLVTVPNFEELDPLTGIDNIAAGGGMVAVPSVMWARLPGSDRGIWARYFLNKEQGGGLSGSGYVMIYGGLKAKRNEAGAIILDENQRHVMAGSGRIGRFAICQHEKKDAPGANHSRGWHPGHCTKCGLDMTVDSSD